jgi:DNA-binding transcriptional MerR regulator
MIATDDQIEQWKAKYGDNFLNDLEKIRKGTLSIKELALKLKVTKETIRFYFHRYYSESDLAGTRFYKKVTKKNQSVDAVGNTVSEKSPNSRLRKIEQELTTIKEMLAQLLALPNKNQSAESTKRDTLSFSTKDRQSEFQLLMEQLDYITGVVESTEKMVKRAVDN